MPAGGEQIIVGQYAVTWNSVTVGCMVGEQGVPTVRQLNKAKPIDNTDRYARTTIDAVHQGVDYFARYTCQEYRAGSLAAFWPFALFGRIGTIGKLYWNMAAPLVLTSIAGVTAFGVPLTLTASYAILAPNSDLSLLFGPDVRTVPIVQALLPYNPNDGLGVACFTTA